MFTLLSGASCSFFTDMIVLAILVFREFVTLFSKPAHVDLLARASIVSGLIAKVNLFAFVVSIDELANKVEFELANFRGYLLFAFTLGNVGFIKACCS